MAVLNNSYVVNGHFDFNPSKLSESVGLRIYAKLKKPKGLFFRNPTLLGVYSENLQSSEIEFLFGVDTDQVPFIGRVRVMLLVEDLADGKWKVVEHPDAKTDYSILSKDIIASFGNRLRPTYDKSVWTDTTKLEDNRAKFYTWMEQRKTAYYEGVRANSGGDPRTWRTFIDTDSQTNFNALKLALALEYWWFMRLGYIKPGVFPDAYMHTTLDISQFTPDTAGNMTTQDAPDSSIYTGLTSLQNLISTNMYQLFQKARDIAVTNYNQRLSEVDSSIVTVDPSDKTAYDLVFKSSTGDGAGLTGMFNGTTYYTWAYNADDDKLGLTTDKVTKLTVSGRDTDKNWMQYWQEYFLFSENEDDNDEGIKNYISSGSRYIGGIDKPDSFYFSNIMRFQRPYDSASKTLDGVVKNSPELTYYKIRMKMNSPGVRYYVGVVLIHKQDIVSAEKASELEKDPVFSVLPQEEKDAISNKRDNLNSDITFTPMISRPDTPDWLDEDNTLLSVHNIADSDSISKFLSANNHLEAEGVNWAVSTDPNVSKFDLMFAIPSDVNKQLTYELKDVNLKTTKFYLQAPWVSADNEIPLIELKGGEHSVTTAVAANVGTSYKVLDSEQGGTTNGPPTDDKNTCVIKDCDIVLTSDFTYKTVTTVEKKNSQVRKFYLFHAEKTENVFRLQNEPIEMTNRDWSDTKAVGKFDPSSKYVIRRYTNDVNTTTYTISYNRDYSVYDNTTGVDVKSTTYYSEDGVNIFLKGASMSADSKIVEPTLLSKLTIKTEADSDITTDYTWNGSVFHKVSDNTEVVITKYQRGTLKAVISGTVTNPDHNLPDLTTEKIPLTKYHVTQKSGSSGTYADTFLVSDEIRISDETFETALQKAYCIASIAPTGGQEYNYYVYSNVAGASGTTP